MARWLICCVLLALLTAHSSATAATTTAGPQNEGAVQLWRVQRSLEDPVMRSLLDDGLIDHWAHDQTSSIVLVQEEQAGRVRRALSAAGVEYAVEQEDLLSLVAEEQHYLNSKKQQQRSKREINRMDWNSYHTLEDIEGYIGWLNSSTNGVVQVLPVASTDEGRPVYVVRVNDRGTPGPKKRIWIEGGIHAREWISPAVTTFLLHQVATNPDWQRSILPYTEWYFVPVANPDGYEHTFRGGRARLWRKNRSINDNSLPDRCKGVDLNRNWDLKWGVGASKNPCSELYMGESPFSEPETDGLKYIMERVGPLDLFITFHSFGQSVLYPWGWTKDPPKNAKMLHRVGRRYLEAVQHVSKGKTDYTLGGSGALLGFASGATDDWAFGVLGAKYAYTIELRDTGHYGFLLPESQIGNTVREAAAGVQCMVTYMVNSGVCARRRRNVSNRNLG
uniref:Carboxypeptidase B-like n=1 Tax=Hirondellea gigas TaxID=1518452 RepID=A0A6A7FYY6_9CRUS